MNTNKILDRLRAEIKFAKSVYSHPNRVIHGAADGFRQDGRAAMCDDILKKIDSLQQEQPIQVNDLTWRDINDIERIINNVHYEFRNGIGEKSFGEEVLERFREERDEQELPNVDLRREIEKYFDGWFDGDEYGQAVMGASRNHYCACVDDCKDIARHFYELGQKDAANKYDEIEYNRHRAEEEILDKSLEEAAQEYAGVNYDCETETDAFYHHIETDAFIAGAKWMAGQGVTKEAVIGMATKDIEINVSQRTLDALGLCHGDKVIVQIRKKEESK